MKSLTSTFSDLPVTPRVTLGSLIVIGHIIFVGTRTLNNSVQSKSIDLDECNSKVK